MSTNEASYLARLEPVAAGVVATNAFAVDRDGTFPRASIDALASAGLLGLLSSTEVGGAGEGLAAAAKVVERLARECSSTAMVVCMHYAATAVIERMGALDVRKEIASGKHLSTLAFSEAGSRSHFWAPMSTATVDGDSVVLQAKKSWVTSASQATSYVWSSRPLEGTGASSIWFVPRTTAGLRIDAPFDGLGLRGNDSSLVTAESVRIPRTSLLGKDGAGIEVMMGVVLPLFNAMNAGSSVGIMESAVSRTVAHATTTKYAHLGSSIADSPTSRALIARMRVKTDMARTLWLDTLEAVATNRADAQLRVLECKAACGETAIEVLDHAMRVCGGAAFRKEAGIERLFRDARAASVMAPTSDALFDFIGKAVCGIPLM